MTKISSFHVSVFSLFISSALNTCVWPQLPPSPWAPPPSFSPFLSFPIYPPLSFQVCMDECSLCTNLSCPCIFRDKAEHYPVAVLGEADLRWFLRSGHNAITVLRTDEEDQQFLCKCVFPCLLLLCYLHVVWNPTPQLTPLLPPPLSSPLHPLQSSLF